MQNREQKYKDFNCFVWGTTLSIFSFGNTTNLQVDLLELRNNYPNPNAIKSVKVLCKVPNGVVLIPNNPDNTVKLNLIIEIPPFSSQSKKPVEQLASTNIPTQSNNIRSPSIEIVKKRTTANPYNDYGWYSFCNGFV